MNKIVADEQRLVGDTISSKKKILSEIDSQGLFPLTTFNDAKITSDPRIKLEVAMRKAGIKMNNCYARNILAGFDKRGMRNLSSLFS